MDHESLGEYLHGLAYAAFAAVAGLLGHVMRVIEAGGQVTLWLTVAKTASSAFAGVLVWLACSAMQIDGPWVGVIVGTSGWMGSDATVRLLEGRIRRVMGIDKEVG